MSKDLPYPVVVKPRVGSGSAGVAYAANSDELLVALKRSFDSGRVPFIQERLPREGEGIGVSLLMGEKGAVRASFVHRRLREYPVQGGPSTLRESFVHDPAKDDALRLLRSFGFTGVAMVEFKMDTRDGKAKLLEINPRFWGSLALAVDSGVNFPWLLTLMAMNHEFSAVQTYRLGHRCRWLLPGDILHFLENSERWLMEPGFFRFKEPHLTYDIIDMQDPFPIIGTFLSLLPFYCGEHFAHVRGRRTKPRSTVIGQLGNRS